MTLLPRDLPVTPHREPDGREADDDALIEKLRARAWDPGLRFDVASVPTDWMTERYGTEYRAQICANVVSCSSNGTIQLKSQTKEVAAYYADAPRGPLFPPATLTELERAERRIGRQIPELLRRVYTEVANGGFGPGGGLASLTEGHRVPGDLIDCRLRCRSINATGTTGCRHRGSISHRAAARCSGTSH
jgi:hypothetical protein